MQIFKETPNEQKNTITYCSNHNPLFDGITLMAETALRCDVRYLWQ